MKRVALRISNMYKRYRSNHRSEHKISLIWTGLLGKLKTNWPLAFTNILLHIPLNMGEKIKKFWCQRIQFKWSLFEAPTYYFVVESRFIFLFFLKWSYSHCFDVAKHCENRHYNRQYWFDVVQRCKSQLWHTRRCFNVDLTL